MAINLARFVGKQRLTLGVVQRNGIVPLSRDYPTTVALIEQGGEDWRAPAARWWR